MHEDQRYIEAIKNGDFSVIGELYANCYPAIRQFVLNNSGKEEDAEDVFQEALIALLSNSENLILTVRICAYLMSIVKNKWLNKLRQRKNREVKEVTIVDGKEYDPTSNIPTKELGALESLALEDTRKSILDAMTKLQKSCEKILTLSILNEKTNKEIAKELDFEESYVKKKKSECLKGLRNLLKN